MKRRTLLSILLLVSARLGLPLKATASGAKDEDSIGQPENWVPISWERILTGPQSLRVVARNYRREDGSLRTDSGPNFTFVEILNIAEQRFYSYQPRKNWQQHPMRPQARPAQLRENNAVRVSSDDPRVTVVSAVFPSASFFEFVSRSGATTIFCPDLNMLKVWYKDTVGKTLEITSISAGVSDEISFTPPEGATIEVKTIPQGPGLADSLPQRKHHTHA